MNIDIKFSVTDAAATELKKLVPESFVRISCKSSGCSGIVCVLDAEEAVDQEDIFEEISGVKFVADRDTLIQLDGVTLDSAGEKGFVFISSKPSGGCCKKGKCSKGE